MSMRIWGWYDDATQVAPTYEPPRDAPCPYCLAPIVPGDMRTISIMNAGPSYAKRSYFYRAHRTCCEAATEDQLDDMDGRIFAAIAKTGD